MRRNSSVWNLALYVLASPVFMVVGTLRFVSRLDFLSWAAGTSIPCLSCGAEISLVGFWRCKCGFTAKGHLLRYCPNCGSFPAMVRCHLCQATRMVPK